MTLRSFLLPLLVAGFATGCGGRFIHHELKEDPHVLRRLWTIQTRLGMEEAGDRGTEMSAPLLVENTLIFGSRSVGVVAIYPGINQNRWVLPIPGGVLGEILHEGGNLYFGGGDGNIYSVSAETGRVNWRYEIRNPLVSRPTFHQGRIYITAADDTLYCLEANSGKWLWHYRRRTASTATIMTASTPVILQDEVLAGMSDGYFVGLALQDGKLKWERRLNTGPRFIDVDARAVMEGELVYISSYDGSLYALQRKSKEVQWKFDSGASQEVTLDEARLYLPSNDGSVYALNKQTGKVIWKFELDHGSPTRLSMNEKYLFFGSSDRHLYVVDKVTGQGVYRYDVGYGSGFTAPPLFDPQKGRLYTLSTGGNLYAFSLTPPPRRARERGRIDPYKFYRF